MQLKSKFRFGPLLGLVTFTLWSCDCYQVVKGTVVDGATGKPLSQIKVHNKYNPPLETSTDSLGQFELADISGGLCPPMVVIVQADNYQTTEVKIPAGGHKRIPLQLVPVTSTTN